jgi:hypothetical protein
MLRICRIIIFFLYRRMGKEPYISDARVLGDKEEEEEPPACERD